MKQQIAIIGMSGRFPGAGGIDLFWENLCLSKESITTITDEENSPAYVKARGILGGVEYFDPDFFSISQREAECMDPQQRLLLECCWEALEHAGYDPDRFPGKIGLFASTSRSTYLLTHLLPNPNVSQAEKEYLCRIGNEADYFTTKVSYKLNLKGPSLAVQTACSSSLVSVCIACNHLLSHQCDMALAGGMSVFVPELTGYQYQSGMIFSPDGHCRPFDAKAQGTVPSNGGGVILLKRLEDAIHDQDQIDAIICGYAVNNDGREKMGFSAPSVEGQREVIASALHRARIDAASIGYVETHGTGTSIGDPIEIKALSLAWQKSEKTPCYIGSVKGNIGHLMEASGIAGLIKTILVLKHRKIPPTLHFTQCNPLIDLSEGSFSVNTQLEEWKENPWPRRAGISSFGFGGTNAHLILEEAPPSARENEESGKQLLVISAKTPTALDTVAIQLGKFLQSHPELPLSHVAYTLQVGRKEWPCRKAFICSNLKEAVSLLLDEKPSCDIENAGSLQQIAQSWTAGNSIDWESLHTGHSHRVALPTYPFEKKRCWMDLPKEVKREETDQHRSEKSIEQTCISIWQELLGCEQLDQKSHFFDLGGDSILALQVLSEIEKRIHVNLPLRTLYEAPTIAELSSRISLMKCSSESSNIIELKSGDPTAPLFMIHPIEGTVFSYETLARIIPSKRALFGIQANACKTKNPTMEEIAASYIQEIKKIQSKGPYWLFGASFGGIVAFEIAQELHKQGDSIALLAIVDALNPTEVKKDNLKTMQITLLELLGVKGSRSWTILSEQELWQQISTRMGLDLFPQSQKEQLMTYIHQHMDALQKYTPTPYDGEILFFETQESSSSSPLWKSWSHFAKRGIKVVHFEGNHLNMLKRPSVESLAKELANTLKEEEHSTVLWERAK
jgi:3-oxoacyl-(acyl-carrier-protein) synthase/thioesterase domain-containing protein/acyl carrier protein